MSAFAPLVGAKRTSISVAIYEYTCFYNGPGDVKFPSDRHAAELTLRPWLALRPWRLSASTRPCLGSSPPNYRNCRRKGVHGGASSPLQPLRLPFAPFVRQPFLAAVGRRAISGAQQATEIRFQEWGGRMRLVLERSAEWDKLSVLFLFDSEVTKRQSRFLPARKRELTNATMVDEHVVNRNGRCAETGLRRT